MIEKGLWRVWRVGKEMINGTVRKIMRYMPFFVFDWRGLNV